MQSPVSALIKVILILLQSTSQKWLRCFAIITGHSTFNLVSSCRRLWEATLSYSSAPRRTRIRLTGDDWNHTIFIAMIFFWPTNEQFSLPRCRLGLLVSTLGKDPSPVQALLPRLSEQASEPQNNYKRSAAALSEAVPVIKYRYCSFPTRL